MTLLMVWWWRWVCFSCLCMPSSRLYQLTWWQHTRAHKRTFRIFIAIICTILNEHVYSEGIRFFFQAEKKNAFSFASFFLSLPILLLYLMCLRKLCWSLLMVGRGRASGIAKVEGTSTPTTTTTMGRIIFSVRTTFRSDYKIRAVIISNILAVCVFVHFRGTHNTCIHKHISHTHTHKHRLCDDFRGILSSCILYRKGDVGATRL